MISTRSGLLCKATTNFMSHRLLLLLPTNFMHGMMQVIVVDANKGVEEMEEEFRRQEEHILGQNKENKEKATTGRRMSEEAPIGKRLMEEEAGNPTRQKLRLLGQEF